MSTVMNEWHVTLETLHSFYMIAFNHCHVVLLVYDVHVVGLKKKLPNCSNMMLDGGRLVSSLVWGYASVRMMKKRWLCWATRCECVIFLIRKDLACLVCMARSLSGIMNGGAWRIKRSNNNKKNLWKIYDDFIAFFFRLPACEKFFISFRVLFAAQPPAARRSHPPSCDQMRIAARHGAKHKRDFRWLMQQHSTRLLLRHPNRIFTVTRLSRFILSPLPHHHHHHPTTLLMRLLLINFLFLCFSPVHINHIRDVAGIDHVGIGAGYDGVNR